MSNANKKKKKASDIVMAADSAEREALKLAQRNGKVAATMLWLGSLAMIAYVVLLFVFWKYGRSSLGNMKAILLASAIVGGVGAAMLVVGTRINKTMKMLSIAFGLLGVFSVSLFATMMLLITDYVKNSDTEVWGSIFSILTVGSLLGGIVLLIISAIRHKLSK